eukprot:5743264-Lingulodinium_polyedra.AAC.1
MAPTVGGGQTPMYMCMGDMLRLLCVKMDVQRALLRLHVCLEAELLDLLNTVEVVDARTHSTGLGRLAFVETLDQVLCEPLWGLAFQCGCLHLRWAAPAEGFPS